MIQKIPSDTDLDKSWDANGFIALPGFYSHEEIDAVENEVREIWESGNTDVVVDNLTDGARRYLCDVTIYEHKYHRFKTNDLYLVSHLVRKLAINETLSPLLNRLLGQPVVLCNSLNFDKGSSQEDHVDSLYMTPKTSGDLIAIWVALEDCHKDAGPLKYYPGSHKIKPYIFSNGSEHAVGKEYPEFAKYMEEHVQALGLESFTFEAKKGDVFIWNGRLFHGGSKINNPELTRKSIVFHYFSKRDCKEKNLVADHESYWLQRKHQIVPEANFRREKMGLPSGFSKSVYWELNPDVKAANVDAEIHYLTHGLQEGRLWKK